MEFTDIMQLVALYAGYFASVFAVSYGAVSLFQFFKSLASPDYKND